MRGTNKGKMKKEEEKGKRQKAEKENGNKLRCKNVKKRNKQNNR